MGNAHSFESDLVKSLNTACESKSTCKSDSQNVMLEIENCPNASVNIQKNCNTSATCSGGDLVGKVVSMVDNLEEADKNNLKQILKKKHKSNSKNITTNVKEYIETHCKNEESIKVGNSVRLSCVQNKNPFVLSASIDKNGSLSGHAITLAQKGNASARCIVKVASQITDEFNQRKSQSSPPKIRQETQPQPGILPPPQKTPPPQKSGTFRSNKQNGVSAQPLPNIIHNGKTYIFQDRCPLLNTETCHKDIRSAAHACSTNKKCKAIYHKKENESEQWCTLSEKANENVAFRAPQCWEKIESGVTLREVKKEKVGEYQCIRPSMSGALCVNLPFISSEIKNIYPNHVPIDNLLYTQQKTKHQHVKIAEIVEQNSPLLANSECVHKSEKCYSIHWPPFEKIVQHSLQKVKMNQKNANHANTMQQVVHNTRMYLVARKIMNPNNFVVCATDESNASHLIASSIEKIMT